METSLEHFHPPGEVSVCSIIAGQRCNLQRLQSASNKLLGDGLVHHFNRPQDQAKRDIEPEPTTSIGKAVSAVNLVMRMLGYALYRGEIFKKNDQGKI